MVHFCPEMQIASGTVLGAFLLVWKELTRARRAMSTFAASDMLLKHLEYHALIAIEGSSTCCSRVLGCVLVVVELKAVCFARSGANFRVGSVQLAKLVRA